MEPPAKRRRLTASPAQRHAREFDNGYDSPDELCSSQPQYASPNHSYQHEEVRDVNEDADQDDEDDTRDRELALKRAEASHRFQQTMQGIFAKYGRDFTDVGDEIDLETGEVIINNGHLENMRSEGDVGVDETDDEDGGILLEELEDDDDEDDGVRLGDLEDDHDAGQLYPNIGYSLLPGPESALGVLRAASGTRPEVQQRRHKPWPRRRTGSAARFGVRKSIWAAKRGYDGWSGQKKRKVGEGHRITKATARPRLKSTGKTSVPSKISSRCQDRFAIIAEPNPGVSDDKNASVSSLDSYPLDLSNRRRSGRARKQVEFLGKISWTQALQKLSPGRKPSGRRRASRRGDAEDFSDCDEQGLPTPPESGHETSDHEPQAVPRSSKGTIPDSQEPTSSRVEFSPHKPATPIRYEIGEATTTLSDDEQPIIFFKSIRPLQRKQKLTVSPPALVPVGQNGWIHGESEALLAFEKPMRAEIPDSQETPASSSNPTENGPENGPPANHHKSPELVRACLDTALDLPVKPSRIGRRKASKRFIDKDCNVGAERRRGRPKLSLLRNYNDVAVQVDVDVLHPNGDTAQDVVMLSEERECSQPNIIGMDHTSELEAWSTPMPLDGEEEASTKIVGIDAGALEESVSSIQSTLVEVSSKLSLKKPEVAEEPDANTDATPATVGDMSSQLPDSFSTEPDTLVNVGDEDNYPMPDELPSLDHNPTLLSDHEGSDVAETEKPQQLTGPGSSDRPMSFNEHLESDLVTPVGVQEVPPVQEVLREKPKPTVLGQRPTPSPQPEKAMNLHGSSPSHRRSPISARQSSPRPTSQSLQLSPLAGSLPRERTSSPLARQSITSPQKHLSPPQLRHSPRKSSPLRPSTTNTTTTPSPSKPPRPSSPRPIAIRSSKTQSRRSLLSMLLPNDKEDANDELLAGDLFNPAAVASPNTLPRPIATASSRKPKKRKLSAFMSEIQRTPEKTPLRHERGKNRGNSPSIGRLGTPDSAGRVCGVDGFCCGRDFCFTCL